MPKTLTALPLLAALALPLGVVLPATSLAQTDTQTEAEADTDAATGSADTAAEAPAEQDGDAATGGAGADLSLGESADQGSELGQPYVTETIGAWSMRCIRTDTDTDPCQMYQLLEDAQGAPVAEFSLFRLPSGNQAAAGATVVVPLETALQQQLTIRVDGGSARRYPFAFCNPIGCYARVGFTSADVDAFKRGREAILTIVPALAPDQQVELSLSLDGFTASYDKASVLDQ
ncbi:invasion associated locus B family protein [Sulfitobacter sp. D35]|uniref:invasion associated locus B family protein n=1 Tax=Sulfitobacter sp. D35 TaxID=3083252 RepID=UPI00296FABA2|nr:invasion associated locus B family protein [Sulfitobacter sp. D35]MDW4496514.1 invasion associated locus B family protein [Sulfitobacter sp. D35]